MARRHKWLLSSAALLCLAIAAAAFFDDGVAAKVPTCTVERGEFRIFQVESGEIRAVHDEKVVAPRVRGNLKIVYLYPEGARVDIGDLILQFDQGEYEKEVRDEAGRLEQARAELEKARANRKQKLEQLHMQIAQQEAAVALAKINLQKAEYFSPIELEQAKIKLEQAKRALEQAGKNVQAQEIANRVELANYELNISHHQKRYDKARSDYERLSVYAARPGIVVYEKIRKRGTNRRGKVTEGDIVWGGTTLLSLPDLSRMQVMSQVGEMDLQRIEVGQQALIRLEAFPGPVFHGEIVDIAPMASTREDAPDIPIFEIAIDIKEDDERLYPGMSAEVEITLETIPEALEVPLGAVFEREGKPVVYCLRSRRFEAVEVSLGKSNGISVVVEKGVEAGEVIALKNPTLL